MKFGVDQLPQVAQTLEGSDGGIARDTDGYYYWQYDCGCKWWPYIVKKGQDECYETECFRHEVMALAALEELRREERRRSTADRDGTHTPAASRPGR